MACQSTGSSTASLINTIGRGTLPHTGPYSMASYHGTNIGSMHTQESKPSVSFCLAAYNEEDNVAAAIEEAVAVGRAGGYDFEVLVCDDGSTDRTAAIVQQLALKYP